MDSSTSTVNPQQSYFPPISSWPPSDPSNPKALSETNAATTTAASPVRASPSYSSVAHGATTSSNPSTPSAQSLDGPNDTVATPLSAATATATQTPSHIDILPSHIDLNPYTHLFPYQSNVYYAQLLHYNKLVSPTRGGGLQATPLPPVVSASNAQAGPRSRSSSKVSLKDSPSGKATASGGHGNRSHHTSDKSRSVITQKETSSGKMAPKHGQSQHPPGDQVKGQAKRSSAAAAASSSAANNSQSQGPQQSSSVPSTPHQRARQFSFESRDPSPNAAANHSPRSAYSETNSTLPSLRPLPPRQGGCKYETSQINSRRRMPYSIGNERLEKVPLGKIKGKLTEEEERKVATDMREVYDRLLPTDKVEEKRKKLVHKLEMMFNEEWPGHDIQVHLFGSSGNLLCSDDSDVDICIKTKWKDMEDVCMIADLLARRGMEKVVCISAAKVPIVKIWDPELSLACDMNVNNTLALENTRMIRIYVEIDPRVRQLMMIIKYWTRRRVVNDAAFGGTLSSYTWICLIVAFLQLRTPSVLPSLHQLPYKIQKPDGSQSDFADNLKRLRGFGKNNKCSEAELLFQFFRFYAHEFDYDKYVLSVRLGKMIPKSDKNWQFAVNNQLCVEEPFNTGRNLGNTADEYSFKGLHMELRRAFDHISAGNFTEACEQFVFPKEEERVWTRPPPQSRPVLLRSASQSHTGSGRGGRGGHRGRHNNHSRGGGGGGGNGANRRSSSSVPTYDNSNMFTPAINIQQDLSWYSNPHYPIYTPEMLAQIAYQQQQLQFYTSNPAFSQQQNMGQPMMASNSNPGSTQSADRSRTNSMDNQASISASLRPEIFAQYAMGLGHPMFAHSGAGYGLYQQSTTQNGTSQDYRRPLQRSSVSTDRGGMAASGSLRSQSQPPTRSPSTARSVLPTQPLPVSQSLASVPSAESRNITGTSIPNFISDDGDFDETPKASSMAPHLDEGKYAAYFAESLNSVAAIHQPTNSANNTAFSDLGGQSTSTLSKRRLSAEQSPQSILDRRMRRTSRSPSPSPLGPPRAMSTGPSQGQAPGTPNALKSNSSTPDPGRPLVVNGSGLKGALSLRPPVPTEGRSSVESSPGRTEPVSQGLYDAAQQIRGDVHGLAPPALIDRGSSVLPNGSSANMAINGEDQSFRGRIAMMSNKYMQSPQLAQDTTHLDHHHQFTPFVRQPYTSQQPQNAVIAPLDLAISNGNIQRPNGTDQSVLSPVYEMATSPAASRKSDLPTRSHKGTHGQDSKQSGWSGALKQNLKTEVLPGEPLPASGQAKSVKTTNHSGKANGMRENGHVRGARSESDGAWQKAGKGKKKVTNGPVVQAASESPSKIAAERKGG